MIPSTSSDRRVLEWLTVFSSLHPPNLHTTLQFPVELSPPEKLNLQTENQVTLTNVSEIDDKMDITILSSKELRV